MKHFTYTILTISTIFAASTSVVLAGTQEVGNDTGNVQTSVQTSVTTGDGNTTLQHNRQSNKMGRSNGSYGNDVNLQENDQLCDIVGNNNICAQRSTQRNSVNRSNSRNNR